MAGEKEKAREGLQRLSELATEAYVTPALLGVICGALGEKDQAFEWLEGAYEERSTRLVFLKQWRIFDPLRADPRFQELLRRVGLPP